MTRAQSIRPKPGLTVHGKIDLCRGLLAWLVVLCHAFATAYAVHPTASSSMTAAQHAILDHTVNAGFVWVMGFFILSGYCIHQAVDRRLSSPSFPLKQYLVARLSRILPLYYLALAFVVVAEPSIASMNPDGVSRGFDASGLLAQLFLVQNLTHPFGSFTPSWSLTNEVFYYLFYGGLAATVGRHRGRPFWIGLGLCVIIGGAFQVLYLAGFRAPLVLRTGMLFGLGFNWFLGVGVAVYREEFRRSPGALAVARLWPIALVLAFVGYHWGLTIQFAYIASGIAFAMLLIRIVARPEPEGGIAEPPWAARLVRFAGLSSYPTYLFHFTWMWLLAATIGRWDLIGNWMTMMVILFGSSLALGAGLGWYAERPIMRWRSELLDRLEKVEPATRPVPISGFGLAGLGKEPR